MKPHFPNVIHSAAFQLRNIDMIRKYLSRDATEQIIQSFITSLPYNNNALLFFMDSRLINFIFFNFLSPPENSKYCCLHSL